MESTLSDGKFRLFILGIPSKDKRFIQPDASEKRMLGRGTEEYSFRTDFPFRCALYALVHSKGIGQSELDDSLPASPFFVTHMTYIEFRNNMNIPTNCIEYLKDYYNSLFNSDKETDPDAIE